MGKFPKANGRELIAAVIGKPIAHSLSPLIHNTAFKQDKLNWNYHAIEVSKEQLKNCISEVRSQKIRGLSVTMPLKEIIIPHLDGLTETASKLNAVNCVFWDGDNLLGDNTDGEGFVRALKSEINDSLDGKSFAIIGSGGAARSVINSLSEMEVGEIVITNRNESRAEYAALLGGPNAKVGSLKDLSSCDFIVNSTPLGMSGTDSEELLPIPIDHLSPNQIVIDLVYNPIQTAFLREAEKLGLRTISGVGMLIHQALIQYERWTGINTSLKEIEDVVAREITKRH